MFDSLFAALQRDGGESEVKDICMALSERGYSTRALVQKVQRSIGGAAAERVRRACQGDAPPASKPSMSSTQRFRVSRWRRLQLRLQDWRDSFEDGVGDFLIRVRELTGRDGT
jgi:hypothetical protein